MRIRLTLASKKDKKPTLNASELNVSSNEILVVLSDGKSIVFHKSRNNKTYYADSWHKDLPMPKIGYPIEIEVKKVVNIQDNTLWNTLN